MVLYGIVADETDISEWNPMLWVILLAGAATALVGMIQVAAVFAERHPGNTAPPPEG